MSSKNDWKINKIKQVHAEDPNRPVAIITYARNSHDRLYLENVEGTADFEILTFRISITHNKLVISASDIESIEYGT